MTGPVAMTVPALAGLRCELKRAEHGGWMAYLFKKREFEITYVVWGFADDNRPPRFSSDQRAWTMAVGRTHFELPETSWKRIKAWFEQVTNACADATDHASRGDAR